MWQRTKLCSCNVHWKRVCVFYLLAIHDFTPKYTNEFEQVEIEKSIDRLIDPLDNNINVILSRIKKKIKVLIREELLDYYTIGGEHGAKKQIILDREYVQQTN